MINDKVFSVDTPEESTGFLLWQLTTLWQREIKKVLMPHNITHPQFVLMASILWLSGQQQDVTQVLLSNHTGIDPMTTSTVLRTLQKKAFLRRREHSTDTRAKTVALTDDGRKVISLAVKAVEQFDLEFFQVLAGRLPAFNHDLLHLLQLKAPVG